MPIDLSKVTVFLVLCMHLMYVFLLMSSPTGQYSQAYLKQRQDSQPVKIHCLYHTCMLSYTWSTTLPLRAAALMQATSQANSQVSLPVQVLFMCTANVLDTIPGPLLDRMEVSGAPHVWVAVQHLSSAWHGPVVEGPDCIEC